MLTPSPNQEIQDMLAAPGIYAVSRVGSIGFAHVEVTADGTCYQLTPDMKRDGILSPGGWYPDSVAIAVSY